MKKGRPKNEPTRKYYKCRTHGLLPDYLFTTYRNKKGELQPMGLCKRCEEVRAELRPELAKTSMLRRKKAAWKAGLKHKEPNIYTP